MTVPSLCQVLGIVASYNKSAIGWQEVFDNNLTLRSDTVVSAWKGTTAQGLLELQVSVLPPYIVLVA